MQCSSPTITANAEDFSLLVNQKETLYITVGGLTVDETINLKLWAQHEGLIKVEPTNLTLDQNDQMYNVIITGLHPG